MSSKGWKIKQLGDLITFQRGHDLPKSEFVHGKYPIAGSNGIIGYHNEFTTKGPSITIGRSGSLGAPYFYENDFWAHNTTLYVKEFHNSDPKFVYYLLKTLDFTQFNSGSAVPSLNRNYIHPLEVFVPEDKKTQHRIAEILSALDDKIELNRQTNGTLEAIAQAIFKEWFVYFNFPSASGEKVESELGMIPKGWGVGRLGDFGNVVCGKTPSKANANYFGGEIPFIKIPDMHNSVFITDTEDSLTEVGALTQKNKFLPPYSLIVSCIATVGLVSLTSKKSQTNQQINAIIPKRDHTSLYLYFYLKGLKGLLKDLGSGGSATLNVNTTSFSNIICVIPDENILFEYGIVIKPLFEKILSSNQEISFLSKIRDTMLPKLMSGAIEV